MRRIDRYEIEGQLGQGGFGEVLRARHTVLGTRVALKLLAPQHSATPGMVERFLREAQLAAAIGNPHIVGITDAGVTSEGQPFLAMELLDGEDLEQRISRAGPLPPAEAIDVTLQILEALGAAHAAGIVHRDMKPANVFLVRGPDGRPFAKLLDFGISKVTEPGKVSSLTKTGVMLGTPAYMAPEQLQDTRSVDHRADLYAVAAILFETLTGQLPYASESFADLMARVQGREPVRLDRVLPQAPRALVELIDRGLMPDPRARFRDASEMADALRRAGGAVTPTELGPAPSTGPVAAGPSVATGPVTPSVPETRAVPAPSSAAPLWLAGVAAGLFLVGACVVGGAIAYSLIDDEPTAVAAPAPPSPPPVVAPVAPVAPPPVVAPTPAPSPPPVGLPQPVDPNAPPVATPIPEGAEPCDVPVVHDAQCDRGWNRHLPERCEVRRDRELHVLAAYEPQGGSITVDVSRTVAPLVLVLHAYATTRWELRVAEGVEIEEIILAGYDRHEVVGAPPGTRVTNRGPRGGGYPIMAWEWEGGSWSGERAAEVAERETRLPLRSWIGCYEVGRFTLGQSTP
ncbi:MAG: serine/threonine-protein kinase [Myxococcota bacterium]|nr:serine/threonine-protein kinase [Myxococcota bacterium]